VFERLFGPGDLDPDPAAERGKQQYQRKYSRLGDGRRAAFVVHACGADSGSSTNICFRFAMWRSDPECGAEPRAGDYARHDAARREFPVDLRACANHDGSDDVAFRTDATACRDMFAGPGAKPAPRTGYRDPETHHGLTHHQGDKKKIAKVIEINCFHIKQFAYLLEKLKSTPEGHGTLLDHVMVTYGSGLSDEMRNDHGNLPLVLAGPAGAARSAPDGTCAIRMKRRWLTCRGHARRMGVPVEER